MMKRLLLCLLALLLCISFFAMTGCKKDEEEVPRGYVNATCMGEPFRFYIPSTWNSTVSYGTSGGYYNLSTTSVVRMQRYPKESYSDADTFYKSALRPSLAAIGQDLTEVKAPVGTLLGELNATLFRETALVSGTKLQFLTYVGNTSESFLVLTFTAADSVFDALKEDVAGMAKNCKLAEPYGGTKKSTVREPSDSVEAPAGMILVSSDDVAYRFFVPSSWSYDGTISISEAHTETKDANLSVVSYLPETSMTVKEFLEKQNGQLITAYGAGYEKLSESEATLGGRTAMAVEYRILTEGKTYRVKALSAAYRGMIYTLTYTATEETYDLYLADAGQAISAFIFR